MTVSPPKIEKFISRISTHFTLPTPKEWGRNAVFTISKGSVQCIGGEIAILSQALNTSVTVTLVKSRAKHSGEAFVIDFSHAKFIGRSSWAPCADAGRNRRSL